MKFEQLFVKMNPRLKAISYKLNGTYLTFDNDDLYQEALMYLWLKYEDADLSEKTDSFILQDCSYFLKNYIRKLRKTIDRKSISLSSFFGVCNPVLDHVLLDSRGSRKRDAIDVRLVSEDLCRGLKERDRQIVSLSLKGFTTREIGKTLGISHVMVIKVQKKMRSKYTKVREELFS